MAAPNIVLVMSDQHRADVLGCAGDRAVLSPHIDALAARGVRFRRTSCQGPLCMPARASFLSERYVRDHGVFTNWTAVDEGSPTYLHALRAAGYHTAMLGKAHLYRDDLDGVAHVDELAPHLHALGFDEVQESGDKFFGMPNRYSDHLAATGLLGAYRAHIRDRSYQGEKETGRNATKRVPMWDSTPMPLPLASYIDAWHGELGARWVEAYDRDKPFFLFVGFPGPHDPWDAPAQAVARYADVEVAMPRSMARPDVDAAGPYGRLLRAFLHLSDTDTMTKDAVRGMRRAYSAAVTVIDDGVGRIVAALQARGMLDHTWVIYTSDHGEMGGDHGLMSKCVFYRQAVNVPLVIAPPRGCAPRSIDHLVEHVDVAATIRAIAGAPALPGSEGRPLLGYLEGAAPAGGSAEGGVAGGGGPGGGAPVGGSPRGGGAPGGRDVAVSENWGFALFETPRFKLVVD
ncbi:MAG TPA: sulfatase-like hydrolase/transferase, partial [Acidimicrobiales bacterium]|nr:sulfatase-like hydrolase/transferase [Acidimicrobiales bacterium]